MLATAIAAFAFAACSDVPEPYQIPGTGGSSSGGEVAGAEGTGQLTDPYNCVAANNTGGTADWVFVKGKVSKIKEEYTSQYGNGTFWISDDGTYDGKKDFYVYRAYYLGNKKFTDSDTQIKVGDEVIICGIITNYNGTIETTQNKGFIYELNGENRGGDPTGGTTTGGEQKGTGTESDPFNVAAAVAKCKEVGQTASTQSYYIKGIADADYTVDSYQNVTVDIVDAEGSSEKFKVYRVKDKDGKGIKEGYKVSKGSTLIVYGKIVNYKGDTPETVQNEAYLVSVDGQAPEVAGGNSGGGDVTPGTPAGTGTQADPFNVAAAVAKCQETGETATNDVFYVKGIVNAAYTVDSYKNATFDLVDAEGASEKFTAYRVKAADGKDLKVGYTIPKGATVIVSGKLVNYKGNTPETAQNSGSLISVNGAAPALDDGTSTGGGDNTGGGEAASSLTNGDFETWADGLPTGWKSASTASNATLAQSTDAHGGSYSCNVNGNESQNKRLASQEIKLAAGSYTFSFWAKATTSDVAQARPGYVPVTDGKVGSYAYGDYANLSTSWQQFSYDFTLDAETTICLVVMNPKKSSYSSGKDILIDDATLTKK